MRIVAIAMLACLLSTTAAAREKNPLVAPPGQAGVKDPLLCKRFPVTGNLARTKRVCMWESEWRQNHNDVQRIGGDRVTGCTRPDGCAD